MIFFLWLCQRLQIRTSKKKLQVFICNCVVRILQLTSVSWGELHWTMADLSGQSSVVEAIRRRERKWFCQPSCSISKKGLRLELSREAKERLSTKICRGSLEGEIKLMGKSWYQLESDVKECRLWKDCYTYVPEKEWRAIDRLNASSLTNQFFCK